MFLKWNQGENDFCSSKKVPKVTEKHLTVNHFKD
jgi:hypothetical protein